MDPVTNLSKYIVYGGSRWYDRATWEFMLETGLRKWRHIRLSFSATTHRPAADLASKLKRMQSGWYDFGATLQGEAWAGTREKKKDAKA